MNCKHFEVCGGCQVKESYQDQLSQKILKFKEIFGFDVKQVFDSPDFGFRARAEFRLHREGNKIFFSMNIFGKNERVAIENCHNLLPDLQNIIQILPEYLNSEVLNTKLYAINLLGGEAVIMTMIYHKKLDMAWEIAAKNLAQKLGISIIGRSRNQKIVIGDEYIKTKLQINHKTISYLHKEGSFSQPNPFINQKMLSFIVESLKTHHKKDLLEMYCGSGNFTIALAPYFDKVFATEVVKTCIPTLLQNAKNNNISNIYSARLSGEETIEALSFQRDFFRLKNIDLKNFDFSHIFVDPPRSGIGDKKMLEFMQKFPYIVYVSCNPVSLKQDLEILSQSHEIIESALFDQFPYTHHIECALVLKSKI